MSVSRLLSLAMSLALAAVSAVAQERPKVASASMPAMAASMPMDCGKAQMKRHDHGFEKGTSMPMSMSVPCAADLGSAAKNRTKLVHDHAKFHKNQ